MSTYLRLMLLNPVPAKKTALLVEDELQKPKLKTIQKEDQLRRLTPNVHVRHFTATNMT